jgi:hypothetical protein
MEMMEDFCVSHNYTQRDHLLPPPLPPLASSSSAAVLHLLRRRGSNSVEIPPKTRYKEKQNETHYENITH